MNDICQSRGRVRVWETRTGLEELDLIRFARTIERDSQEGLKWERRELEWILEEERKQQAQDQVHEAA